MLFNDELTGIIFAFIAALSFGSYGVPMKGEAATRLDVDPLVFQSYKAFTVLATSTILICFNNAMSEEFSFSDSTGMGGDANSFNYYWSLTDFTPWAFVSALLWVPGGTAGVYAIRRAGLAVSVGIWSCVIVMLSFVWGVLIFHEKQRSGVWGAVCSMGVLCGGLWGIAYFSSGGNSRKSNNKKRSHNEKDVNNGESIPGEATPLVEKEHKTLTEDDLEEDTASLDFEAFPHCGAPPQSCQSIHVEIRSLITNNDNNSNGSFALDIPKYHLGLLMAIVNGVLASSIMVPLHYAPPNTTQGVGYSMSFGIAAAIVVIAFWLLRWVFYSFGYFINDSRWSELFCVDRQRCGFADILQTLIQICLESLQEGYQALPSFYLRDMWRPGLLSGLLYSMGNLSGIISIQKLGNFMGYSLNQTSMVISGIWGIFYYREIAGFWNVVGFLSSAIVVMIGILLLGHEHVG